MYKHIAIDDILMAKTAHSYEIIEGNVKAVNFIFNNVRTPSQIFLILLTSF